MGVSGFWSFYESQVKTISIDDIKGRVAFVDIILYIHKYIIGLRKSGRDVVAENGKVINHIFTLSKIIKNFTDNDIIPVCVFDGKSPFIKELTVEKRKEIIEHSKEKCIEMIDMKDMQDDVEFNTEEYIKHFKKSFTINNDIIIECKEYLKQCGIPYITSIGEADPQCAALGHYYKNISCGVFSDDSDILMYGAPCLLRNLDIKSNTVSIIYTTDILKYLQIKTDMITQKLKLTKKNITHENFIDFSIIMGNDYCNGIRYNVGNNKDKLFELFVLTNFDVKTFIDLIKSINYNNAFCVPENFIEKWELSKNIFKNSDVIHPESVDIKLKRVNVIKLTNNLQNINIRPDIIHHIIQSLNKLYKYFYDYVILTPMKLDDIINNDSDDNNWIVVNKKKERLVC